MKIVQAVLVRDCSEQMLIVSTVSSLYVFTAITPPINVSESQYTNYNRTGDLAERSLTYFVLTGTQFGIECNSIASPSNEFVGEITWYKKDTSESGNEVYYPEDRCF